MSLIPKKIGNFVLRNKNERSVCILKLEYHKCSLKQQHRKKTNRNKTRSTVQIILTDRTHQIL